MIAQQYSTDVVILPDAPRIPGLVFRRFRGESDYPNILSCLHRSKNADGVERSDTLDDVIRNYTHLHNCDLYQDVLFAEVDGEAVGYSRVWWDENSEGQWLGSHLCFLAPEWRRKGIGRALLRFDEARLRQIAEERGARGELDAGIPCFFDVIFFDGETGKEALLLREGYTAIRYFFSMVRPSLEDIPEAPMPEGLEVRPAKPEHYRMVWDAAQEAFRDHWSFVPEPEEEYQSWIRSPEFWPDLWKVAWDGDQIAGMVLSYILESENREYNRKRGYTENICVRRPWRKRGLARSLIVQSLHKLKEMGMTEAALGVDAENLSGALRLYESVGFRVIKRNASYRKPL